MDIDVSEFPRSASRAPGHADLALGLTALLPHRVVDESRWGAPGHERLSHVTGINGRAAGAHHPVIPKAAEDGAPARRAWATRLT